MPSVTRMSGVASMPGVATMPRWARALLLALLSCLVLPAQAADSIILTVKAAGCCASKGEQTFTLAQLEALPQTTVTTTTPWTNGKHSYQGVRLSVLLDKLGITANTVKATALNAYWSKLPVDDARKYPVILATRQDGQVLTRRNKGPIFIIYPLSDFPDLDQERTHSFMVWQTIRLDAE